MRHPSNHYCYAATVSYTDAWWHHCFRWPAAAQASLTLLRHICGTVTADGLMQRPFRTVVALRVTFAFVGVPRPSICGSAARRM